MDGNPKDAEQKELLTMDNKIQKKLTPERPDRISLSGLKFYSASPATSVHSNLASAYQDDDTILNDGGDTLKLILSTIFANLICFPIGCLATKNLLLMQADLKSGRKSRAVRHRLYASNLSTAAIVIGILFWVIAGVILYTQFVILKKSTEPEEF